MHHFSEALNTALIGTTQTKFSEQTGIDRPAISDYCNAKRLPDARLEKILLAVGEKHRLDVFIGWLRDIAAVEGKKVEINPETECTIARSDAVAATYPPEMEAEFETLIAAAKRSENKHIRSMIKGLAHYAILEANPTQRHPH